MPFKYLAHRALTSVIGLALMIPAAAQAALSKDIRLAAQEIQSLAKNPSLNAVNCPSILKNLTDEIYNLPPDYFTNDLDVTATMDGTDSISILFNARLQLLERFKKFVIQSEFASRDQLDTCSSQLRATLRTIRELEDLIGLNSLHKANSKTRLDTKNTKVLPFVDVKWPNMLMNKTIYGQKSFDKSMIKSGDIILTKGVMFAAAPISRIGEVDNQFTHIGVAYVDDGSLFGEKNKGQVYFIEAQPDFGLQIVSFDYFVNDAKARVLHFRYNESSGDQGKSAKIAALAARYAAELAYPRTSEKIHKNDKIVEDRLQAANNVLPTKVPYNFALDLAKTDSLFCSQVVSFTFDKICKEQNLNCERFPKYQSDLESAIPLLPSKINVEKNELVKMLDLKKQEIFNPADIELDPRFMLLNEWRDFSALSESRIIDMTLSKVFQYIENYNYRFIENEAVNTMSSLGNSLVKQAGMLPEYTPDGFAKSTILMSFLIKYTGPGQIVVDQLPKLSAEKIKQILISQGMSEAQAEQVSKGSQDALVRILNHVSITTRLLNLTSENLKVKNRYLTAKQMDFAIDQIRNKDCERYIKSTGPVMYHDILRRTDSTDKSKQCDMVNTPINVNLW